MPIQLSTCCYKLVTVSTADEGTSCYICTGCLKPCDVVVLVVEDYETFVRNHHDKNVADYLIENISTKPTWEEQFDELMKPPKFLPEFEGKDCVMCGHPMPNSRGIGLLKSLIQSLLLEKEEEVNQRWRERIKKRMFTEAEAQEYHEYNQALDDLLSESLNK